MSYSPRIVGNKPVPSPSRSELWKKQLGFDGVYQKSTDKMKQIIRALWTMKYLTFYYFFKFIFTIQFLFCCMYIENSM